MSPEYNKAISDFTAFVESFSSMYPLSDSHGSPMGMINRIEDYSNWLEAINRDSVDKANQLIEGITDPDEQETFKSEIVPILQKGMKDLFEGN